MLKDENKKHETDRQQQAHRNERDESDAGHARKVPGKVHEIRYVRAAGFDDLPDGSCKPNQGNTQVYDEDGYDPPEAPIDYTEERVFCV
jgi:hypothetical protein